MFDDFLFYYQKNENLFLWWIASYLYFEIFFKKSACIWKKIMHYENHNFSKWDSIRYLKNVLWKNFYFLKIFKKSLKKVLTREGVDGLMSGLSKLRVRALEIEMFFVRKKTFWKKIKKVKKSSWQDQEVLP